MVLPRVLHLEIVPLGEAARAIIILQVQIVFVFTAMNLFVKENKLHFDGPFEVSALKAAFKNECPIRALMVKVKLVVGLQLFIVPVKFRHATFVRELAGILIVPSWSTVGTLELIGQVKRIENVALLIGFVYKALGLLGQWWELDGISLIDELIVRVFVIIGRGFNAVIDHRELT